MDAVSTRLATPDDQTHVVETLAYGFADDPVWGRWAMAHVEDRVTPLLDFWKPSVRSAIAYQGIWMTAGGEAVALWVPPGFTEVDEEGEAQLAAMVPVLCGERASLVFEGFHAFEASRPTETHWYLSLLATHPDHRGHGWGMALVADRLAVLDEQGMPSYLESSNPANLPRYERAGFGRIGSFTLPQGPTVDRMWRPAR
jgi:GNAT superfamily N-acetyltransferase